MLCSPVLYHGFKVLRLMTILASSDQQSTFSFVMENSVHIPGTIQTANQKHKVPSWCTAETLYAKFSKIIICPCSLLLTANDQAITWISFVEGYILSI